MHQTGHKHQDKFNKIRCYRTFPALQRGNLHSLQSLVKLPCRHWQARYGMAVVVVPGSSGGVGSVYLLGGDSYDGVKTQENVVPGLLDLTWYNGYKNDVWKT